MHKWLVCDARKSIIGPWESIIGPWESLFIDMVSQIHYKKRVSKYL